MDVKKYVETLLMDYQKKLKMISLLEYELAHPIQISENSLIQSMSISNTTNGEPRGSGQISDKTQSAALNYQEVAKHINEETIRELEEQLHALLSEKERLEYYVSLLEPQYAEVLTLHYFKGKSWIEVENALSISETSVRRYHRTAIEHLVKSYQYIFGIT